MDIGRCEVAWEWWKVGVDIWEKGTCVREPIAEWTGTVKAARRGLLRVDGVNVRTASLPRETRG